MKSPSHVMRRLSVQLLLVAGATCLLFQSARADDLLFSDGFNYTVGSNLGGNDSWGAVTANTGLSIGSGNLTYDSLVDLGAGDLVLTSGLASATIATNYFTTSPPTSGSIYYSFLIVGTRIPSGNTYFTALNYNAAPNGGTDLLSGYTGVQGTGYKIGIRRDNATSGIVAATNSLGATISLALNTTNLIVLKYTFVDGATNDLGSIFVNPTPGLSEPSANATSGLNGTDATSGLNVVGFKAQTAVSQGDFIIDDVRIGTTWESVTPIPEPSTLALFGLGMVGLVLARRMRR
jgi:hypothetical protein